jgi:hypothetical protein
MKALLTIVEIATVNPDIVMFFMAPVAKFRIITYEKADYCAILPPRITMLIS